MKNVDKDADYPKNKPYLLSRCMKSLKKYVPEECSCIEITNNAYFWGNPHPYLRFSYSFRPRGESATFLFATMDTIQQTFRPRPVVLEIVELYLNNHKRSSNG